MAKTWAKSFYNSKDWKTTRQAYIDNRILVDGGMCEVCQIRAGYIVHHCEELTPDNINDAEVSLNHDNMLYVCKECHDRFDGHFLAYHKSRPQMRVEFDEEGQPILPHL